MQIKKIFYIFFIILIFGACKKDMKEEEIDLKYLDVISNKTNWQYILHTQDNFQGIAGDLEYGVVGAKVYDNHLYVYVYSKYLLQQGFNFTFKLFASDLSNPKDFYEMPCDFSINTDPYVKRTDELFVLNNFQYDFKKSVTVIPYDYNSCSFKEIGGAKSFSGKIIHGGGDFVYTGSQMFYGGRFTECKEFRHSDNSLSINNEIAKNSKAARFFYSKLNTELHEIFVSENGFLSSAVLTKEYGRDSSRTMVSTGYTQEITYSSSVTILYKERKDNKFMILVISPDQGRMDEFIYNPDKSTFQSFAVNIPLSGNISWIDVAGDGTIYYTIVSDGSISSLFKYNSDKLINIPLNVLSTEYLASFVYFTLNNDVLFGYIHATRENPFTKQISAVRYIGDL